MDEISDPTIEAARNAYNVAPDDREALSRYVRALGDSERHEEALGVVDQRLTSTPDDERALYLRANVLADMGRNEESVKAFKKSAERSPGYAIIYACWATVLLKMHRLDEAKEVLERGHQVDPKHAGILANLTALAGRGGDYDEVIRLARQTIEVDPESPSAWDNLGIALHQKGDLFGAKEAFLKSMNFTLKRPRLITTLDGCCSRLARWMRRACGSERLPQTTLTISTPLPTSPESTFACRISRRLRLISSKSLSATREVPGRIPSLHALPMIETTRTRWNPTLGKASPSKMTRPICGSISASPSE